MVTHDLELARYASRIITIKDGKIVADEKRNKNGNESPSLNQDKGKLTDENAV